MTLAGLEPAIFGSVDQRRINYATGPGDKLLQPLQQSQSRGATHAVGTRFALQLRMFAFLQVARWPNG